MDNPWIIHGYPMISMESVGSVWGHFGVSLGRVGVTLVSLWSHFGITLGSLWDQFWVTLG
jgi:hypothetical protein